MKKIIKEVFIPALMIFILGFFVHSFYNMLPNKITLVFFPVNESIFEHIKMIFSSYILFLLIVKAFTKKEISIFYIFIGSIFNIFLFLIIYLPVYYIFGENLFVTLTIYFLSIIISTYIIKYFKARFKVNKKAEKIAILFIALTYLVFAFLTYHPFDMDFFIDPTTNKKGLNY